MANWVKIIKSGSSVTNLSGYTSGSASSGSSTVAFNTASVGASSLKASTSTILSFVSSSGQGVTLSGNTSNNTITFGLNNVPNSSLEKSSINIGGISISLGASSSILNTLEIINSLTASSISTSYIDFSPTSNSTIPPWKEGRLYYDQEEGALSFYNAEAEISLQIGQEFYVRCYNNTGATVTNGTPVLISGSQGDNPYIWIASAEDHTSGYNYSNHIIGVATHDIENNSVGYVTVSGVVRGINTSTYSAGDILYLQTGSGGFRNTPPPFPYDIVQVAFVIRSHSNGFILVDTKEPVHFGNISGMSGSDSTSIGDLWVRQANSSWSPSKILSGSYIISGNLEISGSLLATASYASNTLSSSYSLSSSMTISSSYSLTSTTSSYSLVATTSSYSISSSFATSASYAPSLYWVATGSNNDIFRSGSRVGIGGIPSSSTLIQNASFLEFSNGGANLQVFNTSTSSFANDLVLKHTNPSNLDSASHGILFADSNSTQAAIRANRVNRPSNYKSNLDFYTKDLSTDDFTNTSTIRMRLTSDGKLGIGTITPTASLAVFASQTSDTETLLLRLAGSNGVAGNTFLDFKGIRSATTGLRRNTIQSYDGGGNFRDLVLQPSGGNIGIGVIPTASYLLHLGSDSAGKPTTNTWTITSDERIKDNIEIADNNRLYEIVKTLPLKRYSWKYYDEKTAPDQTMLGWIAQDVQEVFPKAVKSKKFVITPAKYDTEGNELVKEVAIDDCLDLNADQINKALYGAVQKLIEKVEALEAEVSYLKGSS